MKTLAQLIGSKANELIGAGTGSSAKITKEEIIPFKDRIHIPIEQYIVEALPESGFNVFATDEGIVINLVEIGGEPIYRNGYTRYSKSSGWFSIGENVERVESEDEYTITFTKTELDHVIDALGYSIDQGLGNELAMMEIQEQLEALTTD